MLTIKEVRYMPAGDEIKVKLSLSNGVVLTFFLEVGVNTAKAVLAMINDARTFVDCLENRMVTLRHNDTYMNISVMIKKPKSLHV